MKRTASAHWEGDLKTGKGSVSSQSTVLNNTQYSFKTRFEDGVGTNPEELLAAAHAGCFNMAVSAALTQAGTPPTSLDTIATLNLEGLDITGIHLSIQGTVPGITTEKFAEVTKGAEKNCIISKALKVTITSESLLM
ncbi:MAG: OsmC family protein [Cytophagales bacterium]|jgi:osmotically inducible protein OsmC|nr:OsmC family protein [Cytophagales bacterium]MCA6389294.1 OsmC family protein [Cytophagales bacterium]MCA6392749.1 OsmC family protein [Cytophagales bacterium]MCA6395635.1 OsmC family protein [Cytophagales bacterium]MCA6398065.1 OsmC family protein [Cytophagales bacterium]